MVRLYVCVCGGQAGGGRAGCKGRDKCSRNAGAKMQKIHTRTYTRTREKEDSTKSVHDLYTPRQKGGIDTQGG